MTPSYREDRPKYPSHNAQNEHQSAGLISKQNQWSQNPHAAINRVGKATRQSRVDRQKRKRAHQLPPVMPVDYLVLRAKEKNIYSQADIEMTSSVELKPERQNTGGNSQTEQGCHALLKPDKDESDKSWQKRQVHIHREILSQDDLPQNLSPLPE